MRLDEWLHRGEALLRTGPHPERARRDAEALLLHVVRRERASLLARWKERMEAEEARHYARLIKRRLEGEPMQYIFGESEFYGLPFRVTPDVLIPRPETEHLFEVLQTAALSLQAAGQTRPRIVDVGTGSGAIAVTIATKLPEAQITAIDLSVKALTIARENAVRNGVASLTPKFSSNGATNPIAAPSFWRDPSEGVGPTAGGAGAGIRFLQGDLLEPVAEEQFEIVVSNPPYVPSTDRASLSVEVRDYEPHLALFAGDDGMAIYRRLIPAAYAVLIPGGTLLLEIGYGQQAAVGYLLAESGFQEIGFVPDLRGIPRVACGIRRRADGYY